MSLELILAILTYLSKSVKSLYYIWLNFKGKELDQEADWHLEMWEREICCYLGTILWHYLNIAAKLQEAKNGGQQIPNWRLVNLVSCDSVLRWAWIGVGFSRESALRIRGLSKGFRNFLGRPTVILILTNREIGGDQKAKATLDESNQKLALDSKKKWINQKTQLLELNIFSKLRNLYQKGKVEVIRKI